ncbi:MAG: phospho-N-acetylmuramoyl-pentapeptide-transferase [Gammaproteobacteria bacterium]
MIEFLSDYLVQYNQNFAVLNYLTLRTVAGTITALLISIFFGQYLIDVLSKFQFAQIIREDGPKTHLSKAGTPTMGGIIILFSLLVSNLIWSDLYNPHILILLWVTVSFGFIGFMDDFLKIKYKNSQGLTSFQKLFLQSLAALVGVYMYIFNFGSEVYFMLPFYKDLIFQTGITFFILSSWFVIVGSSNAVNLTDGLDGLAILPVILIAGALGIIAYASGNTIIANYLYIPYIENSGELIVFCGSMIGAGIGFLWFNTYPAQVFMGDVGSLTMGAILGCIAILLRHEVVFAIMAGVFVMEAMSVIIQVTSFKIRRKRVFLMAPIHHHFELKGWPEPKIIVRFWIITLLLILFALASLKIR